jgi:hypothetical protein
VTVSCVAVTELALGFGRARLEDVRFVKVGSRPDPFDNFPNHHLVFRLDFNVFESAEQA